MVEKAGRVAFEPRARVIKLLGEELITDEVIAIVELVKNAFDACASEVIVDLKQIDDIEQGSIIVCDNGVGMNLDIILNSWMNPGTEFRKNERRENLINKRCNRPILGEKGVGRFAAQKLGSMINVITKPKSENIENNIEIDWSLFDANEFLKDVKIEYWQTNPKKFRKQDSGTCLEITRLNKAWTRGMVKKLVQKINILNSPYPNKDTFSVKIQSDKFKEELVEPPTLLEIATNSVYSFEATVDNKGDIAANYEFISPAFPQFNNAIDFIENSTDNDPECFKEGRIPSCGPFSFKCYGWDLDPASLSESVGRGYYMNQIRPYRGIKVYRDGFRIWPYGEEDDDWLSLDSRRVNQPTLRLSRNQIIGFVDISSENNPKLIDKTDREGLIDCLEFQDFRSIILILIRIFENARRKDKNKVDAQREKKRPGDEVYRSIDELKHRINVNKHEEIYNSNIKKIENSYKRRLKDINSTLYMSAGFGIAYMMPAHDISENVKLIKSHLEPLLEENNLREDIKKEIESVYDLTKLIEGLTKGVRNMARKTSFENHKLSNIVTETLNMMNYKLNEEEISFDYLIEEDSIISIQKSLVIVALMNLIDNSSYWVKSKKRNNWKIKVIVDTDYYNKPRIIVTDQGPGFKDPPEDVITPFFSRKPDGSGLGLYIVNEIMKAHEGQLDFYQVKDEDSLYSGASVALIFNRLEKET